MQCPPVRVIPLSFLFLSKNYDLVRCRSYLFLGAFAQSRKAPIIFFMSAPPPARLSTWISAASTGQISMKFDIDEFHENPLVNGKGKGKVHRRTGHEGS